MNNHPSHSKTLSANASNERHLLEGSRPDDTLWDFVVMGRGGYVATRNYEVNKQVELTVPSLNHLYDSYYVAQDRSICFATADR
jgi:hypothetical protein